MQYLGDYAEDYATLNFKFSTHKIDGTPITLAGSPVVKVYKGNSTTTETATGVTLVVDFDGVTGMHNVLIDLSADAFYAVANDYSVVITTGTVDGVSVIGTVLATFSIENRFAEVDLTKIAGAAVSTSTAQLGVNAVQISGDGTAADNLEAACDGGSYNVGGGAVVAASVTGAVGSVTAAVSIAAGQLTFKKNVARANFPFPMYDSSTLALKTGLTVTAEIRKDAGAAFVALAGAVTEIGTTGWYTVDFAQAETNADSIAFSASASGALPTCYTILTQA